VVAGSGIERGFCSQCHDPPRRNGYTCGRPDCMVCVTWEQRLENLEAGRHFLTPRAPQIAVPTLPVAMPRKLIVPT
jgi:hypothetical protein